MANIWQENNIFLSYPLLKLFSSLLTCTLNYFKRVHNMGKSLICDLNYKIKKKNFILPKSHSLFLETWSLSG